jgi:hypothetical protein
MPPHVIEEPSTTRKMQYPNNWHPYWREVERRKLVLRLQVVADNLGVNAVVPSYHEDLDWDNIDLDWE